MNLLLQAARIVLPGRVVEPANLFIEDSRIVSISESSSNEPLAADATVNLRGLTLFPGFIDLHIHGAVGVDTMTATAGELCKVSEFLATQGVTAWLPTFVPAPATDYERAIQVVKEAMAFTSGARILGVHYEGPFVNSAQCGALRSQFFRSYSSPSDVDDLPLLGNNAKKMITVAPEIGGGIALINELDRRGWIVSIGHTRASLEMLDEAFAAGARHLTHFMNAMPPLHHRSPGPVGWGLSRDEVSCDFIADGIHLDREVL